VRPDSLGHQGPLPAGVHDRLKSLPEIRGLAELLGDPAKDDVLVSKIRHEAEQLGFGQGTPRLGPRRER
jgi:hypothetical protein